MSAKIRIVLERGEIGATLDGSATAEAVQAALPLQGTVNRWGDEIYFGIPVNAELEESAQDAVDLGDLAYWPPGSALCIFYGRTPVSTSSEIRPASPVNIIGRLLDDWSGLKGTASGTTVRVELA